MSQWGVEGRAIIVTGAGHGIGRGIARHLGANGATVVVGEYMQDRLDQIMGELDEIGAPSLGLLVDVRKRADVENLVAQTVERFGKVDAIVNNAYTYGGPSALATLSDQDMEDVYNSGVKATLWAMQAVYPHMKAAGWGRIVNVGSGAAMLGMAGFGAYTAVKEAIRGLTRTAAREWAPDGIVANSYCPAAFEERPTDNEYIKRANSIFWHEHPMGRTGDAEQDIAPVVAFLCSDACRYMTGQNLMIDGGTYQWP
jgi:NAD(P)-dependent dehydrogenase (short-subunit alcohol dehydrogenase family)